MSNNTQPQRVLGRLGARVLDLEETKRISAGSGGVVNTFIMTFIGTNGPDSMPDFFHD